MSTAGQPALPADPDWRHYAQCFDREYLGEVPPSEARYGWKCYGLAVHEGDVVLAGLCQPVRYLSGTHVAGCSGIHAELVSAAASRVFSGAPRRQGPKPGAPGPCTSPPGWGCPGRCGMHSNLYLEECRSGNTQAVIALTASSGRIIRADSGIGEAWRAETCQILALLVSEAAADVENLPALRTVLGTRYGNARQYCPVYLVQPAPGTVPDDDGTIALESFVLRAEELGMPAVARGGRGAAGREVRP